MFPFIATNVSPGSTNFEFVLIFNIFFASIIIIRLLIMVLLLVIPHVEKRVSR